MNNELRKGPILEVLLNKDLDSKTTSRVFLYHGFACFHLLSGKLRSNKLR